MYKKNLILLLIIFIPSLMLGQYGETIRTGRPGQAIGAFALGSKVFQVQSGLTYNRFEDAAGNENSTYMNNNVFRLGIWEKFEVSGVVGYRIAEEAPLTGNRIRGVSNTQIGARYNILEPNGAIPALGLQGRVLLKFQK
ncbi:transporter [Antarcticibacterium sp. 1MA-6-2]|uniref:transporter n=1 Tax=Antarcticibacterium sp. 1MA-6-2 TaxID=2908210 RepID=UPI001F197F21|nr:transporter [Antarcticibacterium sp. 1MA-6-2]UJH90393.1 transporter [Antarcticibacterium sp. 1MA-6-2]